MSKVNRRTLLCKPSAIAYLQGTADYPLLYGTVSFFQSGMGIIVLAECFSLPGADGIFAMHIHNGVSCTGDASDPFSNAGSHFNPTDTTHPFHAGDLPALLSNHGYAWSTVYTERFSLREVIGLPVIIHSNPDDYHTQPSGNAGAKIACGIIRCT